MSMNNTLGGLIAKGIENPKVLMGGAALAGLYMFKKSAANSSENATKKLIESLPPDMFAPRGISTAKTVGIIGAVVGALSTIGVLSRVAFMHGKLKSDSKGIWNAIKASWHSLFGNDDALSHLIDKQAQSSGASGRSIRSTLTGSTSTVDIEDLVERHEVMNRFRKKKGELEKIRDEKEKVATAALKEKDKAEQAKKALDTALNAEKAKKPTIDKSLFEIRNNNYKIAVYQALNEVYKNATYGTKLKQNDVINKSSLNPEEKQWLANEVFPESAAACETKIAELIKDRNKAITSVKDSADPKLEKGLFNLLDEASKEGLKRADIKAKATAIPKDYSAWIDSKHTTEIADANKKLEDCTNDHKARAKEVDEAQAELKKHLDKEKAERLEAKGFITTEVANKNEEQRKKIEKLEQELAAARNSSTSG